MDEYTEIREHLRKSHDQNTREVCQREHNSIYQYQYSGKKYVRGADEGYTSRTFFLKVKVLVFFAAVFIFSCYIYGGQDIKKGAIKAFSEIKIEINHLEEKEPKVKEAMVYVRRAYHKINDIAGEYMEDAQIDSN